MTSSELKKCLWIFCPQRTLHDIPKIPQIGVNQKHYLSIKKSQREKIQLFGIQPKYLHLFLQLYLLI